MFRAILFRSFLPRAGARRLNRAVTTHQSACASRLARAPAMAQLGADSRVTVLTAFRAACANGEHAAAETLARQLDPTPYEVQADENAALRAAIEGGHDDLAIWLIRTYYCGDYR